MLQPILLTILFATQALLLCTGVGVSVSYTGTFLLFSLLYGIGALFRYAITRKKEEQFYLEKSGAMLIWYGCLLVLGLMFYKVMLAGGNVIYQATLSGLQDYYGITLTADLPEEGRVIAPILLMVFLSALLLPLYQWGERNRTSWWFFVDVSIFVIMLPMLIGNAPKLILLLFLLGALLLYRLMFFSGQWQQVSRYGQTVMGTALLVVMGVALLLSALLEPSMRGQHDSYQAFQRNLESRLGLDSLSDYNSGYLTNSKPVHTHQVMLSLFVKTLPQSKLYLRGYVGAKYNGSNWQESDKHSFYEEQQKSGESKLDASISNANYIFDRMGMEHFTGERITISYNRVNAPYVYAPYFSHYINDARYLEGNGDATLLRKTDERMDLFYMEPGLVYESGVTEGMEGRNYEEYVNAQYKEVPKNLKKKLLAFLGDNKSDELDILQKLELVTNKLQEQCEYRQELDALSMGEDYVEHFLWEEQAGYCTHFATTATLLFRCLDVPARYASGYQVNPDDFVSQGFDSYLAEVPDDMAHAWTEIYVPNAGWVPVETTPGYEDVVQQTLLEYMLLSGEREDEEDIKTSKEQAQTTQPSSHAEPTTQAVSAPQQNFSKKQTDTPLSDNRMLMAFLLAAGVIVLCVLVAVAIHYGKNSYERHLYRLRHQKNHKQALYAVTEQLMKGLKRRGYQRAENEEELQFLKTVIPELIFSYGNERQHSVKQVGNEQFHQGKKLTREELDTLILCYYGSLSKAAYSLESITKDDVFRANQLYDCLFK